MPSTRPPLRRIVWTLGQLRAGRPLKAADLAGRFGVGVRTAYRDRHFLRGTPDEEDLATYGDSQRSRKERDRAGR